MPNRGYFQTIRIYDFRIPGIADTPHNLITTISSYLIMHPYIFHPHLYIHSHPLTHPFTYPLFHISHIPLYPSYNPSYLLLFHTPILHLYPLSVNHYPLIHIYHIYPYIPPPLSYAFPYLS